MASRKRALLEPTDDWQQLQFQLDWLEQTRYELIRPVVVFGAPPIERAKQTGVSASTIYRRVGRFDEAGMQSLFEADPEFARGLLGEHDIRPCIACSLCHEGLVRDEPIQCAVNPDAGHEYERPPIVPSLVQDEVLIIGGGLKGMELAVTLATGGRRVRLVEREARLGGDFALAISLRAFPQYGCLLDWYKRRLHKLSVAVELEREVMSAWLGAQDAAVVIDTRAAAQQLPRVPGITESRVIGVRDWLRRGRPPLSSELHTVWGRDAAAMAVADDIAARGGAVQLVSGSRRFGEDLPTNMRREMFRRLTANPAVTLRSMTEVSAIEQTRVCLLSEGCEEWVDARGPVIVAGLQGARPGDSIQAAIAEGRRLGRELLSRHGAETPRPDAGR